MEKHVAQKMGKIKLKVPCKSLLLVARGTCREARPEVAAYEVGTTV